MECSKGQLYIRMVKYVNLGMRVFPSLEMVNEKQTPLKAARMFSFCREFRGGSPLTFCCVFCVPLQRNLGPFFPPIFEDCYAR